MLLVPIALLGTGWAILASILVAVVRKGRRARNWPTAPGRIVRSDARNRSPDRSGVGGKINAGLQTTTFVPEIQYQYSIAGKQYKNDRIGIGWRAVDRATAAKLSSRYAEGTEVVVSFDPVDPRSSVLDPSVGASVKALSAALALITVFLCVLILLQVVEL